MLLSGPQTVVDSCCRRATDRCYLRSMLQGMSLPCCAIDDNLVLSDAFASHFLLREGRMRGSLEDGRPSAEPLSGRRFMYIWSSRGFA